MNLTPSWYHKQILNLKPANSEVHSNMTQLFQRRSSWMQLELTAGPCKTLLVHSEPAEAPMGNKFQAAANKDKLSASLSLPHPLNKDSKQHSILSLDWGQPLLVCLVSLTATATVRAPWQPPVWAWILPDTLVFETRQNGSTQLVAAEGLNRVKQNSFPVPDFRGKLVKFTNNLWPFGWRIWLLVTQQRARNRMQLSNCFTEIGMCTQKLMCNAEPQTNL